MRRARALQSGPPRWTPAPLAERWWTVSTRAVTPVLSEREPRPFGARPVRSVQARARRRSPPGFFPAWARPTNGSPWQEPRRPPGSLRPPPRPRTRELVNSSDALNAPQRHPWATIPLVAGTGRLVQPCNHKFYSVEAPGKRASG